MIRVNISVNLALSLVHSFVYRKVSEDKKIKIIKFCKVKTYFIRKFRGVKLHTPAEKLLKCHLNFCYFFPLNILDFCNK